MLTEIYVEFLKLKRSKIVWVCLAAPFMVGLLFFLLLIGGLGEEIRFWPFYLFMGFIAWAYFMLPMTATVLTTQVAQLEHGPKTWAHLFSLPVAKWRIYMAKAVVALILIALTSTLMAGFMVFGGWLGGVIDPSQKLQDPSGMIDLIRQMRAASGQDGEGEDGVSFGGAMDDLLLGRDWRWVVAERLALVYLASFLLIAIQLWVALSFRQFMIPIAVGVGGVFVTAVMQGFPQVEFATYFPWRLAEKMLGLNPEQVDLAFQIGFFGGLAALILMMVHMSRMGIK